MQSKSPWIKTNSNSELKLLEVFFLVSCFQHGGQVGRPCLMELRGQAPSTALCPTDPHSGGSKVRLHSGKAEHRTPAAHHFPVPICSVLQYHPPTHTHPEAAFSPFGLPVSYFSHLARTTILPCLQFWEASLSTPWHFWFFSFFVSFFKKLYLFIWLCMCVSPECMSVHNVCTCCCCFKSQLKNIQFHLCLRHTLSRSQINLLWEAICNVM